MTDGTVDRDITGDTERPFDLPRIVIAVLPIVLLLVILGLFAATAPLSDVQRGESLPDVTISHTTIPNDETIVLHVTNNGPDVVTISQVLVDEAYWNFEVEGAGGDRTLNPRESAQVIIPYHWEPTWDYEVDLVLAEGETIEHEIEAAQETPSLSVDVIWSLAAIGLFVGVIPVAIGMLWYPYIRSMRDRWLHAVLLFAAGVLAFLAFDAGFEALELTDDIPGVYEGELLIVLGVVGAALLVQAIGAYGDESTEPGEASTSGLQLAYLVAVGIGLHNLAEGLAIGSAFALGRASLGAFLVIGFMLHNVTEGPAVVAPAARERRRPALWHFVALGAIAGVPVIIGGWIGSLAYAPIIGAFFLAVGVGAILQVDWEIANMVRDNSGRLGTATNLLAFLAGFIVMYATDLLVAI